MDCEENYIDNILIIKLLNTRLDAHTADDFKSKMRSHIESNNSRIVMDFSEVNFIDSTGLGTIVSLFKMMKENGDIVISGATDSVMRMFKLTRMNKIFIMADTVEFAIGLLKKEDVSEK